MGNDISDEPQNLFDLRDSETKLILMYSVWIIAFLSFINYLPGGGWTFYQIPVAFAAINFVSFIVFLIIPMVLVKAFVLESQPCNNDEDFTCDIQLNSVVYLYNFLYNGYGNDPSVE